MLYHVTLMLGRCAYVRCLMIDFTKAFDLVIHPILLAKLHALGLSDCAIYFIYLFISKFSMQQYHSRIIKYTIQFMHAWIQKDE